MDYLIKEGTLTDIANAIRDKTGSSSSIKVSDFASEIESISGGGGGGGPSGSFIPTYTETKIMDNSAVSTSTITFTEDYHNYPLLKVILYNITNNRYTTQYIVPEGADKAFVYSANKLNFNESIDYSISNQYCTYQRNSNTEWQRVAYRSMVIYEVYGITFTNCTFQLEEIYSRGGYSSTQVTPEPLPGTTFFDYDALIYMSCTGDNTETQFAPYFYYIPSFAIDRLGKPNIFYKYNQYLLKGISPTSIGTERYFYVAGIKLIPTFDSVTPINSPNPYTKKTGLSGTDVENLTRTIAIDRDCTIVFADDTYAYTNTSSNEGYIEIKLNDTLVVKQYLTTSTNTSFTIPNIQARAGDQLRIYTGFDNVHSSCEFQLYTAITFTSNTTLPLNTEEDPLNIIADSTSYRIQDLFSYYTINRGRFEKAIMIYTASDSGYEGFCFNLAPFNLVAGRNYIITFELDVGNITFYGSYPWGIKYSNVRIPTSGAASTNTFNITPDQDFLQQTGRQMVSFQFTADTSNYIAVLLSRMSGSQKVKMYMRNIRITEA